jgi:3-methyladenine DNA glycosylase AlkD
MNAIIRRIGSELDASADAATKAGTQRFFKEPVVCHGVKSAGVVKIARNGWKEVRGLDKAALFALCEELYRTGSCEEAFIAADWVPRLADRFERGDLKTFTRWIEKYIDNWAKCDTLCNHAVGDFVEKYPDSVGEIIGWGRSKNRWLKRAAAVSLIIPAKRGRFLDEAFAVADLLLSDPDDMVQKGYGWLLKEASRLHQKEVFAYVVRHRAAMPRTALRYAIADFPNCPRMQVS